MEGWVITEKYLVLYYQCTVSPRPLTKVLSFSMVLEGWAVLMPNLVLFYRY